MYHHLDTVIQHKDFRSYTTNNGSVHQRYGNVYYHANLSCITQKQPHFNPAYLRVSQAVVEKATKVHSNYLAAMLGVNISVLNL